MHTDTLALGTILKRYRLRVPTNQREYSWEEDHVRTLYQDWAANISEPDYFLGAIVAVTKESDELEIVDGQQRLLRLLTDVLFTPTDGEEGDDCSCVVRVAEIELALRRQVRLEAAVAGRRPRTSRGP